MKRKLVSILAVLLCLGACTQAEDERGSAFKLQEAAGHGQEASDRAKDEILAMEEVISVRGIQYKEEMVMAMHVKQVDRFQLKDVRKKAFDRIKALYPDYTIHISTDKKIYKELEDAENKVKAGNLSEKELEKTINVIEKHSKG
ncbi:hypothetical protein CAY60_008350 [Shouchella clausii]|uniref:Sporulation protein n=1 Tax=Shouchella clausii TaxID=79880 RepID=A0A268RZG4_SHOCL|nr:MULTISPECIES: YhcN/YlaJ family sporulation lipoprotein [Shouchella]MCM3312598.1 hypothetical protein [Psychrobacillus sp. MER TA 17]PAD42960.1 hypothetical protein CHH54_09790 [Bacillus sp. 7520-S]KKI85680.1 hypothetical protein WZ76_14175 [Shouchella clausii]MBU3231796.1 hypothetical protein [Shouchella clausii]MBU3264920.1 hypothetical protein [Shouchella clausii]